MVIALREPRPPLAPPHIKFDDTKLKLDVHLSVQLGLTASQAKRKVAGYLIDEVSMFLGPEQPLLLINSPQDVRWRFPISLMLGLRGYAGQVGVVDVDAQTGVLMITEEKVAEMITYAEQLAYSTSPTAK